MRLATITFETLPLASAWALTAQIISSRQPLPTSVLLTPSTHFCPPTGFALAVPTIPIDRDERHCYECDEPRIELRPDDLNFIFTLLLKLCVATPLNGIDCLKRESKPLIRDVLVPPPPVG